MYRVRQHLAKYLLLTYFSDIAHVDQTSWGNSTKCAISQKIVNQSWVRKVLTNPVYCTSYITSQHHRQGFLEIELHSIWPELKHAVTTALQFGSGVANGRRKRQEAKRADRGDGRTAGRREGGREAGGLSCLSASRATYITRPPGGGGGGGGGGAGKGGGQWEGTA